MDTPTALDVRAWSNRNFDWADRGYPSGEDPDSLTTLTTWAVSWLQSVTGRLFDSTLTDATLVGLAQQATLYRVQQLAYESQEDYQETATDDVVASFTAGSYSETHVDPIKRAMTRTLNQNPGLARVLWALMTPEMVDYWTALLSGKAVPAFDVTEVDWAGWFGPYEMVPGAWGGGWGGDPDGID